MSIDNEIYKIVGIKAMQEWRMTRITDSAPHDWSMFIRPDELAAVLDRHGLALAETVGLAPRAKPPVVLPSLYQANRGRLSYGELSQVISGLAQYEP